MSKVVYAASITAAIVIGRAAFVRGMAASATSSSSPLFSSVHTTVESTRSRVGRAFRGSVVHSLELGRLQVLEDALLLVSDSGTILDLIDLATLKDDAERNDTIGRSVSKLGGGCTLVTLTETQLLIPGFVDGHAHAPQYAFVGTGMDLPLLQWLEKYTFPCEAKFSEAAFAEEVFRKAVSRSLRLGTTTCSWFSTIHRNAAKVLVNTVRELGQRAHVGKVSMDRNSPEYYVEETAAGVKEVEEFVDWVHATELDQEPAGGPLPVEPLVTASVIPRFVPSCSPEMMDGLATISRTKAKAPSSRRLQFEQKRNWRASSHLLPVHSHLSESVAEIAWVKELHPDCDTYAEVYQKHGLLHQRSYMAHCVHCCPREVRVLKATEAGVVHCASSNFMLKSGVMNARVMLNKGIKVGLGTDIGAGYSNSILDALRQAVIASRVVSFTLAPTSIKNQSAVDEEGEGLTSPEPPSPATLPLPPKTIKDPLDYAEAFHLATLGGATVLGLDHVCGNFEPGKQFDALLVDLAPKPSPSNGSPSDDGGGGGGGSGGLRHGASTGPVDLFGGFDSTIEKFEKFLYLGDDRNIVNVFVDGRKVVS